MIFPKLSAFRRPGRFSLRNKIIVLCCSLSAAIALIVGGLYSYRAMESTRATAIEALGGKTRQMALRLQARYDVIQNAANIIAEITPVNGLVYAGTHPMAQKYKGTGPEEWKKQLQGIFTAVMASYPTFVQMRLVGMADGGREIVRVNRTEDGMVAVPDADLQQKGAEPYMLKLADGHRQFFWSGVTFNREHGKVAMPLVATLRAVSPVFTPDGKIFGAIIINVDFDKMQKEMFRQIQPGKRTYLLNQNGDFILYDPTTHTSSLDFEERHTKKKPAFMAELLASKETEGTITDDTFITHFVRLRVTKGVSGNYVAAAIQVPQVELLADVHAMQRESLLLILLLTLLSMFLGTVVSRRLTQPLVDMTEAIQIAGSYGWRQRLPLQQKDEIGDLARAFIDLTEALSQNEIRTSAILNNTVDGILSINAMGIIDQFNPACEKMFGYRAAEIIGQNVKVLVPSPYSEKHDDYIKNYLETGESRIIGKGRKVQGRCKDGSLFYLDVAVSEYRLGLQPRFTAVMRDITERIKVEETQKQLMTALANSNQELDQFAYVASHDLKAPLRVIDNASGWLEEDLGPHLDEDSKENMALLRGRVRRMEKLLDDLLEYSRIGRKLDERSLEIVSGRQLAEDIRLLSPQPDKFTVRFAPEFSDLQLARMPLQQILFNLISNAIKHHDKETGTVDVKVEDTGDHYVFSVQDDGPGIAKKYHEKIFQMFQTLQSRDRVEGSGMGLAIIKKHLEQHGETISLISEEGNGSCFRFTWHKRKPPEATPDEGTGSEDSGSQEADEEG